MTPPKPKSRSRTSSPALDRAGDWPGARFHVVSGKGGTGKTTVASAMAMALASDGGKVLLIEVEGRQGLAQLFDTPPLPYAETRLAIAPGGGEVYGLAIDAEEALLEYLELFYRMRRAGSTLRRLGAIDFATTIAPGLRDVLLTGKAMEAVKRTGDDGAPVYDAVVMDAPPTGRISRFLNVNSEVSGLAKVGPIRNQADSVMGVIKSPLTVVHLVTLLEEMPVQETIDGVNELRRTGLPVGGVIVNLIRRPRLNSQQLLDARDGVTDRVEIRAGVRAAGLVTGRLDEEALIDALAQEGADHATRVDLERRERERLDDLMRPVYELPQLNNGIDMAGLYALADSLMTQGLVGHRLEGAKS